MAGLTGVERELFRKGLEAFETVNSVQGDANVPNSEVGLGPTFNLDSCAGCHSHPAAGGTSPAANPQIAVATREGARNRVPSFVRPDGPVFQVRFRSFRNGARDGSVRAIYTITGKRDAAGCEMRQPEFEKEARRGNLSFRIPTPLYGAGLIEAIPDSAILENRKAEAVRKRKLGIQGRPNRDPRDGAVTRFGWKAQTRSLELFAAEAYVVEQGVTNEIFPQERGNPPDSCLMNATPEDRKVLIGARPVDGHSNVTRIAHFMRFLSAPAPIEETASIRNGRKVFGDIGCGLFHTPELRTGRSAHPALAEKPVPLYSDLLLHHMGAGLADGIVQGIAGSDEFRTAPLWGLGLRLFFLHDGRTRDLAQAILLHDSSSSEAHAVIVNYRRVPATDRQDLLDFLRSL